MPGRPRLGVRYATRRPGPVSYESDATDLVPGLDDRNQAPDVFVRTFRPELRADPSPLDFGEVRVGETVTATVRFDHVGVGPLTVENLDVDGDKFAVTDQTCVIEGVVLQQKGNCLAEIEFAPLAGGAFDGVLRLTLTDESRFTVDLLGTGVPGPEVPGDRGAGPDPGPARFAAGPDPLNFGKRLVRSTVHMRR